MATASRAAPLSSAGRQASLLANDLYFYGRQPKKQRKTLTIGQLFPNPWAGARREVRLTDTTPPRMSCGGNVVGANGQQRVGLQPSPEVFQILPIPLDGFQ